MAQFISSILWDRMQITNGNTPESGLTPKAKAALIWCSSAPEHVERYFTMWIGSVRVNETTYLNFFSDLDFYEGGLIEMEGRGGVMKGGLDANEGVYGFSILVAEQNTKEVPLRDFLRDFGETEDPTDRMMAVEVSRDDGTCQPRKLLNLITYEEYLESPGFLNDELKVIRAAREGEAKDGGDLPEEE